MTDRPETGMSRQDPQRPAGARPSAGGVKGVLVRVPAGMHRDLKLMAVREDTSIQALMLDAIRDMLGRIGPPR